VLPVAGRVSAADVVRIGNVPIDSSSKIYAAQAEGFLSRAGISAQVQSFTNGNTIAAAVIAGALDIGSINVLSVASAHEKGVPIKLIGSGSTYTTKAPTTEMLVTKASPLHNARDLAGKTVAVNVLKGIAHISAQGWIDKNGGDATSVKFVEVPFASMPAALKQGRVDAAVVAEPQLSGSRGETRVLGKSYDGIADRWLIDGYAANESWIAANSDLVRRFAEAMRQAAIWANHHQDRTAEIVSKAMNVDPTVVRSMRRATFIEKTDLATVQPVIDAGARYGALEKSFPAADLFTREALKS